MTDASGPSPLLRPVLGIGLLLLVLAVAVGAGLLIALRGIVWLPDALVRAGVVDAVTTPLVFACTLLGFAVAGAVMVAVIRFGLVASNALGDYLGFESD